MKKNINLNLKIKVYIVSTFALNSEQINTILFKCFFAQHVNFVSGIHQSDIRKTGKGIMRLALFLRNTKELVCLLDDVYCTRMWCIWELATFLRLRENPQVSFVSMSLRSCGVIFIVTWMIQNVFVQAIAETTTVNCNHTDGGIVIGDCDYQLADIQSWQNYMTFSVVFVCCNVIAAVGFIFGQRHFRADRLLRKTIETYDIRNAQCSMDNDRAILLKFVNDLFFADGQGGERGTQRVERGLDAFNHAVRTTVPQHGVATSGIRKYTILSYVVAVLVPLQLFRTS